MKTSLEALRHRQIFRIAHGGTAVSAGISAAGRPLIAVAGCTPDFSPQVRHERFRWNALKVVDHARLWALVDRGREADTQMGRKAREMLGTEWFTLAVPVSPQGAALPDAPHLCILQHPSDLSHRLFPLSTVDLVGYGPALRSPDGVTITQRRELAEAASREPWHAAALWPRPERMVQPSTLTYGDVVKSEQFACALSHTRDDQGDVFLHAGRTEARYPHLGEAEWVVTDVVPQWHELDGDQLRQSRFVLRKVPSHGRFDPWTQKLEFTHGNSAARPPDPPPRRESPFQPMELVGRMKFSGTVDYRK